MSSGRREGGFYRQIERDCDVESLICNGCITQMLGVICQPGLSYRVRAALGEKELDTVLSLFTPVHNRGTCKYQPPFLPPLPCPPLGVLSTIETVARERRGVGGLIAGRCGEKCDIGPIRSFSCHILELEMMGCSLRPCLTSLGSTRDSSPSTLCPRRESVLGGPEKEGGNESSVPFWAVLWMNLAVMITSPSLKNHSAHSSYGFHNHEIISVCRKRLFFKILKK